VPEAFATRLGRFHLGDARELVKSLPDASVDAVVTDPPWGVGFDKYDNFEAFLEVAGELHRVLKPDSWLVLVLLHAEAHLRPRPPA